MIKKAAKFPPLLIFIIDASIINFSFVLAYYIRFELLLPKLPATVPHLSRFYGILILVTLLWLALFKLLGLYDKKDITSTGDEAASIIGSVIIGTLLLLALLFMYRGFWFSRGVLLYSMILCSMLMIFSRFILSSVQRELYKRGIGVRRTLIVGAGEIGQGLANKMITEKEIGYKAVAFLDDDPQQQGKRYNGIAVIDSTVNVKKKIREMNIDEVLADLELISNELMRRKSDGVGFNDTAISLIKMVTKDFVELLG